MFRSFESFNYRIFFFYSSLISAAAYGHQVTIDWLVLDITGSAKALGIMGGLQMAPYIFLSPIAGRAADRFNKRTILLVSSFLNLLMAVLFFIFYHLHFLNIIALAVMIITWGCINAIEGSIRIAFSVELVSADHRTNAVSLNSVTFNIGRLIGPLIAGILIAKIDNGAPFILFFLIYLFLIFCLGRIRDTDIHSHSEGATPSLKLREAWEYLMENRISFLPMVFSALLVGLGMNFSMFSTLIVKKGFLLNASYLGILSVVIALGSIIGAGTAAKWAGLGHRPGFGRIFKSGIFLGIFWSLSAFMPNFWSFAIVAGAVAVMQLIVMATTNSFVVSTAPPGYLGRIYGIYLMIFWIGATVGAPIVGYFAQHLGIRVAIFTGGAITTLVSTTLFVKKKGV